jgi:hypothetical protein
LEDAVKRNLICALAALLAAIAFVPVGLYLQWRFPIDGPFELLASCATFPLLLVALVLLGKVAVIRPRSRKLTSLPLAVGLLVFFGLIQATILLPPISRRIGPWHQLRARLVTKSQEIGDARARLGGAEDTHLTPEQWTQIEKTVFATPEEFVFPVLNKRVTLKMMGHQPPYVGIDYGDGRRAVFDLSTMWAVYAD